MEKLGVQLRHASRIKAGDSNGKSDPYVVFFWKGTDPKSGKKSSVVKETLEPVWNESFQMAYDKDVHDTLVAQVWDNDTVGKDFLGEAEISVDVMTSSTGSYSLGPREGQSDSGITGTLDVAFDLPPSLRSQSGVVGLRTYLPISFSFVFLFFILVWSRCVVCSTDWSRSFPFPSSLSPFSLYIFFLHSAYFPSNHPLLHTNARHTPSQDDGCRWW